MKKKFLILAIVTFFFVSCEDEDAEPSPANAWANHDWINIDPGSVNIVKVKTKINGDQLIVNMWGDCDPDDCPWGALGVPIVNPMDSVIGLHWDHGFKVTDQILQINKEGELVVNSSDVYLDNSGRTNRYYVDIFR